MRAVRPDDHHPARGRLAGRALGGHLRRVRADAACSSTRARCSPPAASTSRRAEEEWEALRRANDRISAYATRASLIFVSHYHEDHFRHDPGLYAGRHVWAKDPKRHIAGRAGPARRSALWSVIGGSCRHRRRGGPAARDGGRGAAGLAAAEPRAGRHRARLRGRPHRRGPPGRHALRARLRRAGPAVRGGRRLPGAAAPDAALPVGPARLSRVAAGRRADGPGDRAPAADHRSDRLPGDPRSPRAAGRGVPGALPPAVGDRARGHRGGLPGGARRAARGAPPRAVDGAAQAADAGAPVAGARGRPRRGPRVRGNQLPPALRAGEEG